MRLLKSAKPITLMVLIGVAALLRTMPAAASDLQKLTVAGGCFWCVEADFEKVPGVVSVVSGFTGGSVENPTYKQVTGGSTGHFEAVQITFDANTVSRQKLLSMFLRSIDPTDAGGQFCDRGDSYRSAIFVSNSDESSLANRVIAKAQTDLGQNIVTPVLPAGAFYPADAYHQDFYKGSRLIITRFGPKRQASAYLAYRRDCGRDQRVRDLWGSDAPFAGI